MGVAVQDAIFATLFVVEHELDGNAGLTRPFGMRRVAAIADQIPRVIGADAHDCITFL